MLIKKTSKNQITLPKAIISRFPAVEYFDVMEENGCIVLVPIRPGRAGAVRGKLAELGITPQDVDDAVTWVRKNGARRDDCDGLRARKRPGTAAAGSGQEAATGRMKALCCAIIAG